MTPSCSKRADVLTFEQIMQLAFNEVTFRNLETKKPPSTRYQGSKLKLLDWIWQNVSHLPFHTALDAFGGTGSVAYRFKQEGKKVTYNDLLRFNEIIGKALIENSDITLSQSEVDDMFIRHEGQPYDNFIERTFSNTYFTDEENQWLDVVAQNISAIEEPTKQALAFYALFQSCIIKRPYNLFHRKNLYMRTAVVPRGFGNKTTWDIPFEKHFRGFVEEINKSIVDTGISCKAVSYDASKVPGAFDLVYIDPPYLNDKGVGVDYLGFYHFLEGLTDYENWPTRVDYNRKHFPLFAERSPWSDRRRILDAFEQVFERFRDSLIIVSYRNDGIPSEPDLTAALRNHKSAVTALHYGEYRYVLSKNTTSREMLLIGE